MDQIGVKLTGKFLANLPFRNEIETDTPGAEGKVIACMQVVPYEYHPLAPKPSLESSMRSPNFEGTAMTIETSEGLEIVAVMNRGINMFGNHMGCVWVSINNEHWQSPWFDNVRDILQEVSINPGGRKAVAMGRIWECWQIAHPEPGMPIRRIF